MAFDKTLKLIQKALQSDPTYYCGMTSPVDMLWDAYHSDAGKFDAMVRELKKIENA